MNEQLIEDQRHDNPMRGRQLADRMSDWLAGEYTAALGTVDHVPAFYALWRPDESGGIHLRQFFVARDFRRRGLGRAAIKTLREEYWQTRRVALDVLIHNERGIGFWRSLGFEDYAIAMRLPSTTLLDAAPH